MVVVRWTERHAAPERRTAEHLAHALGAAARVACAEDAVADVVVVPPPRWTCLWRWRSTCGAALRSSVVPVVVASRRPRPLRRCVVAAHAGSPRVEEVPAWLARIDDVELALALDAGAYASSLAGAPVPAVFVGAALEHAASAAERTERTARARLRNDVVVTQHVGRIETALFEALGARGADLVVLADARELLFLGGLLRWLVEGLGVAVLVPPPQARATTAVSALP